MKKVICVLFTVFALITAVSALLYKIFLRTDITKFPQKNAAEDQKWLKKVDYKDHYITSFDKTILHGYSVKNCSDSWVIIVHGYDSEGRNMACYAEHFYNMGYNVLIPDQRGYGLSEGNKTTMGFNEKKDILEWIDKLNFYCKPNKIILFGVSMGAATVMLASENKLPDNVLCAIEDCGYTSAYDEFKYNLKRMFHMPALPIINIVDLFTRLKDGWSLINDTSCIKAVRKSDIPILFIHGSADEFVPFYMHDELYNAARCTKDKLVIYGAAHAESYRINPDLYWAKIAEFLKKTNYM